MTQEQLKELTSTLQRERGKKGGRSFWDNLPEEKRKKHLERLQQARDNYYAREREKLSSKPDDARDN